MTSKKDLTEGQLRKLEESEQHYLKIAQDLTLGDEKLSEETMDAIYQECKYRKVPIHWVYSPKAALSKYKELEEEDNGGKALKKDEINNQIYNSLYCNADLPWIAYAWFRNQVLKNLELDSHKKRILDLWLTLAKNVGWWFPYDKAIIAIHKPEIVALEQRDNNQWVFHNPNGPAFRCRDGYEFYALNDVHVPKKIVMTPAERLDPNLIKTEKNAEVRKEIFKKLRTAMEVVDILEALNAKIIDVEEDYQLLMMTLGDGRQRPWLKMRNPSTGEIHIEGVSPECRTVKEAKAFRNLTDEEPDIIT